MEARDVVLAIVYLNEKAGRRLNERGILKIAEKVGVDAREAIKELRDEGLIDEKLSLTERGRREAEEALERIEREVRKGIFGGLKWASFKSKLAPPKVKGSCLGPP